VLLMLLQLQLRPTPWGEIADVVTRCWLITAAAHDDDDEYVREKLPVHQDLYEQNEIQGYTDFSNAEDLGNHFLEAKPMTDGIKLVVCIGDLGYLLGVGL
jgi:hypothetical protein